MPDSVMPKQSLFYCICNANLLTALQTGTTLENLQNAFAQNVQSLLETASLSDSVDEPRLVVALSGGLDSVVLLNLCHKLKYPFRAIYIDHQLQPESNSWGNFCSDLCSQWKIPFKSIAVQIASKERQGVESVARKARYAALFSDLESNELLLTAHHQNDQAETFLLNAMRQTGIQGLAAMPEAIQRKQKWHLRPMLQFSRNQLLAYAQSCNLNWVEDPSNQQLIYRRNWLRHQILPAVQHEIPSVVQNLAQTAKNVQETTRLMQRLAQMQLQPELVTQLYIQIHPGLDWIEHKNLLQYWLRNIAYYKTQLSQQHYQWLELNWYRHKPGENQKHSYKLPGKLEMRIFKGRIYLLPEKEANQNTQREMTGALNQKAFEKQWTFWLPEKSCVLDKGKWIPLQALKGSLWYSQSKKSLKNFFQQEQVPPWERSDWPVIAFKTDECDSIEYSVLGFYKSSEQSKLYNYGQLSQTQLWKWLNLLPDSQQRT